MDERQALQQMRQGQIEGLEEIVARYQDRAVKAAFLIIHDRSQAEDIVQAAFVKVYKRIDQYDSQRPFGPWFLRIVTNDALKHVQRQRDLTLADSDMTQAADLRFEDVFTPEQQLEQKERQDVIWQALQQLSPEQRAVVVLRYFLDVDETSIAAQLKTPSGTIRWRLYAARQQLRILLAPFFKFGL